MSKAERVGRWGLIVSIASFSACVLGWWHFGKFYYGTTDPLANAITDLTIDRTWDFGLIGLYVYLGAWAWSKYQARRQARKQNRDAAPKSEG